MKSILSNASGLIKANVDQIHDTIEHAELGVFFYRSSIHKLGESIISIGRDQSSRFLMVISAKDSGLIGEFTGEQIGDCDIFARKCPLNHHNAVVLRRYFPWTTPVSLRNRHTTIGCGDRIGLATYGQLLAIKQFQVAPVLAQQSMRELKLTGRTYNDVIDDATFQVFQAGYKDGFGADADHLKTVADIDTAINAGMTMITLDLADQINYAASEWEAVTIDKAFDSLPSELRRQTFTDYTDREFKVGSKTIRIDATMARRCALMYSSALAFVTQVYRHLEEERGQNFDLEISLDETAFPTAPEHHLYFARELARRRISIVSLAPRFVGQLEKAVDYRGDLTEFTRHLELHAAIAHHHGYKLSIHSGSDKFAILPLIGQVTEGRVHLKTSGVSWLEAVGVIAQKDPALYRVMHQCAIDHFAAMKQLYQISTDPGSIPHIDQIYNDQLAKLMELPEARQLFHITYGAIMTDKVIRPLFFAAMHKNMNDYVLALKKQFEKHLSLLGAKPR